MRELDERPHPVQVQLLSSMSPGQKARLWDDMTRTLLDLGQARLRQESPEASDLEIRRRLATLLYGRELAERAYGL